MAEQPAHTRYVWGSNPHPATDLLLLDGDGFGKTESNWENIEIEENLIKLKNGGMEKQSPSRHGFTSFGWGWFR